MGWGGWIPNPVGNDVGGNMRDKQGMILGGRVGIDEKRGG